MKKIKDDLLNIKRNSIPGLKASKEEMEKNRQLLEEVKQNQTKPAVFLPKGFNYNFPKKKIS